MPRELLIASPRGFCAGVRRAIQVVEEVLARRPGEEVYVFNEIVHNTYVVNKLRERGVKFIHDVSGIPENKIVIFSAHGVAANVARTARERSCTVIDATCPLVSSLHAKARRAAACNKPVIIIGHPDHPEMIGTIGQLSSDAKVAVVDTPEAVSSLPDFPPPVTILTQTTLNACDIMPVEEALKARYGEVIPGHARCYATENRQNAVLALAAKCDKMIIIGSPHSSNSRELCRVAEQAGCPAILVDSPAEFDVDLLKGVERLGLSAGASAPSELLCEMIEICIKAGFPQPCEDVYTEENVGFALPDDLKKL